MCSSDLLLLLPAAGEKAHQHQRTERQSCDPLYCFHHASHWQNAAKAAWFFVIQRYYSENRSPCKGEGHKSYSLLPNCSCFSAQVRRVCGMHAAAPHPPIFFPEKENGRCGRPKERRLIGSLGLERPLCLRNEDDCARRRRVSVSRRFGLLLLSAAALPSLQKCGLISVYRQPPYCSECQQGRLGRQKQNSENL